MKNKICYKISKNIQSVLVLLLKLKIAECILNFPAKSLHMKIKFMLLSSKVCRI